MMSIGRIWFVALLGMGAVLLAACGETPEDAIERAEAGYVSMDRDARQSVIDDLQEALDSEADITSAERGRATAWLGLLLVRHGRWEDARTLLADFDATADQLLAAGDPVPVVRGLGALGGALVGLQRDFDAGPPLIRALEIAEDRKLMTDLVVIDPLIEMAWLTYLPGIGDKKGRTRSEAKAAAEAMLAQAEVIAHADGGTDDPRLGIIDLIRANILVGAPLDPGLSPETLDSLARDAATLLELGLSRLPSDHPSRVAALVMLAELNLGVCDVESMERLS
jgi:hypothetical protein